MSTTSIALLVAAVVVFALYLMRRKSRLSKED